jgi:hypothetical protein
MSKKYPFRPRARLLLQLGDQLIRNESIALLEIIKNAYDADASTVTVSMKNLDDPESGEILIEDNGIGMDNTLITEVWMQPGSDYKGKLFDKRRPTKKYGRLPLGEKGIGRFGVHKLGSKIELISKQSEKKEVFVKIDWEDFKRDALLEKIGISINERSPQFFQGEKTSGTIIKITSLKGKWNRGTIRDLYRSIMSLNSPFDEIDSFKVLFKLDNQEWLEDLLTFQDIKDRALYYGEASIGGNEIRKLRYEFRPWPTMKKLAGRKIIKENIRMIHRVFDETKDKWQWIDLNLPVHGIGKIKVKVLIFDLDSKVLSLGVEDKRGFKDYLKVNGGVRVFRDGVRVYDYGEPGNDWLNLDIERVNRPGLTISNNIIIGAVYLNRAESTELIEKTNREGFIENAAFFAFQEAVRFGLSKIAGERNIDKEKVRKYYSPTSSSEPVVGTLRILRGSIEKKISNKETKAELIRCISDVEKDYKAITEIYVRSAGAGLSLGIVIHEIEKIVKELTRAVNERGSAKRMIILTKHLSKLVEGYTGIIRYKTKSKEDLRDVIDQALFNVEFRTSAHNTKVIREYRDRNINSLVKCSGYLITSVLMNLIDNSLWWLNYGNVQSKKILIDLTDEISGYTTIVVADNGPGFSIPPQEAIKPFITDKPGGMGIGLHIASEVMNSHNGELMFPEVGDLSLPPEFKRGAVVLLAFKE